MNVNKTSFYFLLLFLIYYSNNSLAQTADEIFKMSLEELLNVKITTAAKFEQNRWESPSTVSVITAEDIKIYGHRSVWDALKTIVGSIPSDNGNNKVIGLRGLLEPAKFNSRILWLIDGHTMNESYFQWYLPGIKSGIDIDNIKRIEIVRGPGSVLYGSNAFVGIVNIITKNSDDLDGLDISAAAGGVLASAGGFELTENQKLLNNFESRISFGKKFTDESKLFLSASKFENTGQVMYIPYFSSTQKGGLAEYADYERATNLLAKYNYKELSFIGQFSSSENGKPLADYGSDPNNKNNKTSMNRFFAELKFQHELGTNVGFMTRGYIDNSRFEANWIYDNNPHFDTQTAPSTFGGLESNIAWKTGDHFILGGFEFQQHHAAQTEDYPSEDNYYSHDEYNYFNIAFYVQDNYKLNEFTSINLGLRYEYNQNYHGILLGRGAIVYNPLPETVIKLQYGDAFMNPLLHDYYYHSSTLQLKNYEITNLKRERQRTLEIVWDNKYNKSRSEVSLFYTKYDNFIDITHQDYYANMEAIFSYGMEFTFNYFFSESFSGYVNSTLQASKNSETKVKIENSPDYSVKIGSVIMILPSKRLSAGIEAQVYGKTDLRDSPQRPDVDFRQQPYILANVNFVYKLSNNLNLSAGIYNVFNSAYYYVLSKGEHQPLYGNGRSFLLRAGIII